MEGWRFIKSMESLINRQTLSSGFYVRISTACLVTLLKHNQARLIFKMFTLYFQTYVYFAVGKQVVCQNAKVNCERILQKASNVFGNLWNAVLEKKFDKCVS